MTIHFVCRGNAFRSIIAEAYLNSLHIPGVTVISTGTVASQHRVLNAPNYPKTMAVLERHGIKRFAKNHYGDDTTQELLDESDITIFANQIAYEEAVRRFNLPKNTFVWDITDVGEQDRVPANDAERERYSEIVFQEITKSVDDFVQNNIPKSTV